MANNRPELDYLRAQATARHRAATRKIARLNRVNGVAISGTSHDPRRDLSKVTKNYNSAQLRTYIDKMDKFVSRSTGFVAGAEGSVIRAEKWREYVKLQNRYNALGRKHEKAIGNYKIPTTGMTVEERMATIVPKKFVRPGVNATNRPYVQIDRKPQWIRGEAALDKFIEQMKSRINGEYLPTAINKQRETARKLFTGIGDEESNKLLDSLSDNQFNVIWNYTPLAAQAGAVYPFLQGNNNKRWTAAVAEDHINDIREVLNWAKNDIPEQGRRQRPTEYTDTRAQAINTIYTSTEARAIPIQKRGTSGRRR